MSRARWQARCPHRPARTAQKERLQVTRVKRARGGVRGINRPRASYAPMCQREKAVYAASALDVCNSCLNISILLCLFY